MKLRPRSIRTRLALWFTVAMAAILFVFAVAVFGATRAGLSQQLRHGLDEDFGAVVAVLDHDPGELAELYEHGAAELFIVTSGDGILYASAPWLESRLDEIAVLIDSGRSISTVRTPEEFLIKAGRVNAGGMEYRVAAARSEEPLHNSLRTLALTIGTIYPIVLALSYAGGYFLTGRLLAPIASMANKARQISAERLSERLPIDNPEDELGRLALVFNDTLAGIEESFLRLRRFTSDASHELRTPLTAIRSVGEVGLREGLHPTEYRDVIGSILEETDRLTHLVDSLLTLTRADAGHMRLDKSCLPVRVLIEDVVELLRVLIDSNSQSTEISVPEDVACIADRQTIRLALINIVDNAIKYTPAGGRIQISAGFDTNGRVRITVNDSGPGIPSEHLEKIFDRFYRVEDERGGRGGTGLGLAIARWAVEVNGGTVTASNTRDGGATFTITLEPE